jgi:hypothetical protein
VIANRISGVRHKRIWWSIDDEGRQLSVLLRKLRHRHRRHEPLSKQQRQTPLSSTQPRRQMSAERNGSRRVALTTGILRTSRLSHAGQYGWPKLPGLSCDCLKTVLKRGPTSLRQSIHSFIRLQLNNDTTAALGLHDGRDHSTSVNTTVLT